MQSDLEVLALCMRWTVDTRNAREVSVSSSPLVYRQREWSLYYVYNKQHVLCLKKLSDVRPNPFNVLVQVENGPNGQISSELSHKKRCSDTGVGSSQRGNHYHWGIWWKSDEEIERLDPKFRQDGHLRFRVFIAEEGAAILTDNTSACLLCRSSPISHEICLESLSEDFAELMVQGSDPDVEFQCAGQSFKAHKSIVCSRSPVIAAMLASDMVEGRTRVVKVPNIEPDIFHHILRYIYTGKAPELTVAVALSLYESSDQYALHGLAKRCSQYLLEHISVQNACEVLVIADAHGNADFKEAVINFMMAKRVPQASDQWKDFCSGHPMLAIEVLNTFCHVDQGNTGLLLPKP